MKARIPEPEISHPNSHECGGYENDNSESIDNSFFEKLPKGDRKYYRARLYEIIVFPGLLCEEVSKKFDNIDISSKNSIKLLAEKIASYADINPEYVAYAFVHDDERVTKEDVEKEKILLENVYNAYNSDTKNSNLKLRLMFANKHKLATPEAEKFAKEHTFEEFLDEYRYYSDDRIGTPKALHIHIFFYLCHDIRGWFNLFTIRSELLARLNPGKGSIKGITNPFIPYGTIGDAIYYLPHPNSYKKNQYDPHDIISIKCNDGFERFQKAMPSSDVGDNYQKLTRICQDMHFTSFNALTDYLFRTNRFLFDYCFTTKGRSYAIMAVKEILQDDIAKDRIKKHAEDLEYREKKIKLLEKELAEKQKVVAFKEKEISLKEKELAEKQRETNILSEILENQQNTMLQIIKQNNCPNSEHFNENFEIYNYIAPEYYEPNYYRDEYPDWEYVTAEDYGYY